MKYSLKSAIAERVAHLREERPLILGFLDAVGHQPFHGFGAVLVELAEVRGQIASSHHEDNLKGGSHRQTADETEAVCRTSSSTIDPSQCDRKRCPVNPHTASGLKGI